jgi:hypothetical protein
MTNAYNPGSRFTQRSPYGPRIEADGKTGRIRRGKGQKSARAMTTALSFVCLVVAIAAMPRFGGGPAWAQQQTAPAQTTFKLPIVKQIALTEGRLIPDKPTIAGVSIFVFKSGASPRRRSYRLDKPCRS